MSHDADVRRLVRDLLRTGLDVEQTLDIVLDALKTEWPPPTGTSVRSEKETQITHAGYLAFGKVEDVRFLVHVRRMTRVPVDCPPREADKWTNTGNGAGDEFGGSDYP